MIRRLMQCQSVGLQARVLQPRCKRTSWAQRQVWPFQPDEIGTIEKWNEPGEITRPV